MGLWSHYAMTHCVKKIRAEFDDDCYGNWKYNLDDAKLLHENPKLLVDASREQNFVFSCTVLGENGLGTDFLRTCSEKAQSLRNYVGCGNCVMKCDKTFLLRTRCSRVDGAGTDCFERTEERA